MGNLNGFNRSDAPVDEFSPLAAGTYETVITESSMVPYKSGNGEMLKVVYEVISENGKGRKIFDNMNLFHPTSEKAKQISWASMGKILDAVGKLSVDDSSDLHNIPMTVDVEIDGQYNRIKRWHAATTAGKASPQPAPAATPAAPSPEKSGDKAPWE